VRIQNQKKTTEDIVEANQSFTTTVM